MPQSPEQIADRLVKRPQPTSKLFGRTIVTCDAERGFVEAEFDAPNDFATAGGFILGGFVAAMLDDLAALAAIIHADQAITVPTLSFTVNFLKPVVPGRLRGDAQCLRLGRSTAFLEARLFDIDRQLLATMSATAAPQLIHDGENRA
jgi:uncharacterized protein (TIGR00369 family)